MAARVRDALSGSDRRSLLFGGFRETVGPSVRCSVGGAGVDDPDIGVIDQRDCLSGSIVRKAQEYDIRGIQEFLPLVVVVTLLFRDPEELQIISGTDPVKDLQTCGSCLSVDIHLCLHALYLVSLKYAGPHCTTWIRPLYMIFVTIQHPGGNECAVFSAENRAVIPRCTSPASGARSCPGQWRRRCRSCPRPRSCRPFRSSSTGTSR